jgi:hypothetical protein
VNWYQSLFGGNLLLRPYFNYQPVDLYSGADEKINGDLVLFPNPASSEFTIHWNGHDEYDLKVTDMLGRFKMQLQNWSSSSISVDNWSSGIYFILLEDRSTGESQYAKLIVN